MDEGTTCHIKGLYYSFDNSRCVAGHRRLFGAPGRGWMIYAYHEQAPGWALHRIWNLGLFCIHHIGDGKATDTQGWHVTFAGWRKRHCCGSRHWRWADKYSTRPTS